LIRWLDQYLQVTRTNDADMSPTRQGLSCLIVEVEGFHEASSSGLQPVKKQGGGQEIGTASGRNPAAHELVVQPMQALEAARRAGAAGNEHCLGSGLCRMECGKAAAM